MTLHIRSIFVLIVLCGSASLIWLHGLQSVAIRKEANINRKLYVVWKKHALLYNGTPYLNMDRLKLYKQDNQKCLRDDGHIRYTGIILVTSYVGNQAQRTTYRNTITNDLLRTMGLKRIFLIGSIPDNERNITQTQLINEQSAFGDLLQGEFEDTYRNNVLKNIMGLEWVSTRCGGARFIFKLEDDVIFDIYQLLQLVRNFSAAHPLIVMSDNFLMGKIVSDLKPLRDKRYKWHVTAAEYAPDRYPDYLMGCLYVTNICTARRLVQEARHEPLFWIDDIWLTGLMRQHLGMALVSIGENSYTDDIADIKKCIVYMKKHRIKCDHLFYHDTYHPETHLLFQNLSDQCQNSTDPCLDYNWWNVLKVQVNKILQRDIYPMRGEHFLYLQ